MLLIVTAPKLNKRSSVPAKLPDPTGIIGKVNAGFRFDGEEVALADLLNPTLGKWYKDRDGHFYWGGGVVEEFIPETIEIQEEIPWWMKTLGITSIWKKYNEKGALAKVAVIDSGYNTNNPEIDNGVVGTYLHPSLLGHTTINDNFGHGSYCSSLIGSRNEMNIIGCAPECQLYISKMSNGSSYKNENMLDAIEDAIKNEVDIISISNGGIKYERIEQAIKKAIEKNIIVVAAIGNNEDLTTTQNGGDYPALYKECVAVGATDKNNSLSTVTLINGKTEINAPGEDIVGYIKNNIPEKYPISTSSATAIVAGICALIISQHKKVDKPFTSTSIKNLIIDFFEPVTNNPTQKLISPTKIFDQI